MSPSENSRFSYGKTFLLGFGFFGVMVIWSTYNLFVPPMLESRFKLSSDWIGFFLALDNFAALLIQPPVGAWSDKLRTPIGRRMPFILVGAPLGALAFGLIPFAAALPLFVICTSTLLASMALWRTPVVALMPDITPPQFRSQANGVISFMGGVGAICATLGGAALYERNPAFPFWMGGALVLGATLLLLLFVREPKIPFEAEAVPGIVASVRDLLRSRDRDALLLFGALFCSGIGYSAIEGFWTLYAQNHLGLSQSDGSRLLSQLLVVFVAAALPVGLLAGVISRRVLLGTGVLALGGVFGVIYAIPATTLTKPLFSTPILGIVPVVGLLLMVAGFLYALVAIHGFPLVADLADQSRQGTFTGLYYLFSTLGAIAGPILAGAVVRVVGNYNATMLFAPVWMIASFVLLMSMRRVESTTAETGTLEA